MKSVLAGFLILFFCIAVHAADWRFASYVIPQKNTQTIRGKIGEVSAYPDPQKAPYADCFFAAEFFPSDAGGRKIILLFPCFVNRVLSADAEVIKNELSLQVKAVPFEDLPPDMQPAEKGFIRLTLKSPNAQNITFHPFTFSEQESMDIRLSCGGVPEEEVLIPVKKGKNMRITLNPRFVAVDKIVYMKMIP